MKRAIASICAVAIAAGLLAASASANVRHFKGNVRGGGTVEFDVWFKNGVPKAAGSFKLRAIPAKCDQGHRLISYSTQHVGRVHEARGPYHEFHHRWNTDGRTRIFGYFTRNHFQRAGGVTQFRGEYARFTDCYFPSHHWRAEAD